MAGIGVFVLAVAALHLLRPEYDPLQRPMSVYAVGPYGYLMTAASFAGAATAVALGWGLARTAAQPRRVPVAPLLLGMAAVAQTMSGIFPADVTGDDTIRTAAGQIHRVSAIAGFVCAAAAAVVASLGFRRDPAWRPVQRLSLALALFMAAAGVATLALPFRLGVRGGSQRLAVAVLLLWFLLTACRLRSMATGSAFRTRPVESG